MSAHVQPPPPYVAPRVSSAPNIRQLYWCAFRRDTQLPEFRKRRPVVIVSFKNTLYGAVTVVPCSTQVRSAVWPRLSSRRAAGSRLVGQAGEANRPAFPGLIGSFARSSAVSSKSVPTPLMVQAAVRTGADFAPTAPSVRLRRRSA